MLAGTAGRFGDLVAIRDGGTELTYAQLAQAADEFGAALVESGLEPGERIAIWCFNCI
jgi:non-ribosomal peptide synthetase component E (peptide arylation enzyme)